MKSQWRSQMIHASQKLMNLYGLNNVKRFIELALRIYEFRKIYRAWASSFSSWRNDLRGPTSLFRNWDYLASNKQPDRIVLATNIWSRRGFWTHDGHIVRSCELTNVPWISTDSWIFRDSRIFGVSIRRFKRINPNERFMKHNTSVDWTYCFLH